MPKVKTGTVWTPSDDPEMIGVPVHSEFELLDSVLHFRFYRRICFHRHVEFMFNVYCLTDILVVARCANFFNMPSFYVRHLCVPC